MAPWFAGFCALQSLSAFPMTTVASPPGIAFQTQVLHISAPVSVVLAEKKVPLAALLALVPGTMIQFEKRYDTPLTLEVGGHPLACGEAVKVDDKFGLRVQQLGVPSGDEVTGRETLREEQPAT